MADTITTKRVTQYELSLEHTQFLRITNRGQGFWRFQVGEKEEISLPDYTAIEESTENEFQVSEEERIVRVYDKDIICELCIDAEWGMLNSITYSFLKHGGTEILAQGMLLRRYEHGIQCSVDTDSSWRVLGLGEKTGGLNKKGNIWEMWNTDEPTQFAETDPLYASIPIFFHHRPGQCLGVLVNSTARLVFDCGKTYNREILVSVPEPNLDICMAFGDGLSSIQKGIAELAGYISLPPIWSLGFHQSRYSYYSDMQVKNVVSEFRRRRIPCDVIHLDIHYMDYFRVFTWNNTRFPNIVAFIEEMKKQNIHFIAIVDPGVKVDEDYPVYQEGIEKGLFVTRDDGTVYIGEVWPGDAVYPDFFNKETHEFWAKWHSKLLGMGISGIWNDMNEPANFSNTDDLASHGRSLPSKTEVIFDGKKVPFDRLHNAYGTAMAIATIHAFAKHAPERRPFILTRAASLGAQRHAALWTGDNTSWWEHLRQAVPMLLNLGLSAFPFVGGDVGGFQEESNAELYTRWMGAACLMPFFRGHSVLDSGNHEPWAFDEQCEEDCRSFISLRYRLLPYLYTQFYLASRSGVPIMRSLGYEFENDIIAHNVQDQFLVGDALLVAPILVEGNRARTVYLPDTTEWYEWETKRIHKGGAQVQARGELSDLPMYVKAGSIIANEHPREHTGEERNTPLILHVYPDKKGCGSQTLYIDAGEGMEYMKGEYLVIECDYTDHVCALRLRDGHGLFPWEGVRVQVFDDPIRDGEEIFAQSFFLSNQEIMIETTSST